MCHLCTELRRFAIAREGTAAMEYAVIAVGISVAIIAVVNGPGTAVQSLWTGVASALG
jgi:pilus assembly protein Flp/PilA